MERHSLDTVSLVAGLVFLSLGAAGLAGGFEFGLVSWRYVVPLLVIGVGAILAITAPLDRPSTGGDGSQTSADGPPADSLAATDEEGETASDPQS